MQSSNMAQHLPLELQAVEQVGKETSSNLSSLLTFLIALFVLPIAIIPSTYSVNTRYLSMPGGFDLHRDNLWLFVFFATVFLVRLFNLGRWRITAATWKLMLLPFIALGLWQLITLLWNGQDSSLKVYSALQSVNMIVAVTIGVLLVSGLPNDQRNQLVRRICQLFILIGVIYMLISFAFPSLRPSSEWQDQTSSGLGFIRVRGPLGTPITLIFVLSCVLGFAIGSVVSRVQGRKWNMVILVLGLLMLVGTGSRGAILCAAAFATFFGHVLGWWRWLPLLLCAVLIFGTVLLFTGIPERYLSLEDSARMETYKTALRTASADSVNWIGGVGHGELYSQLHDETQRKKLRRTRWYLASRQTEFGWSLRVSHSVYLRTLVETGLVGLGLLLIPVIWVFRTIWRARGWYRLSTDVLPAIGGLCGAGAALMYMGLDEFFVSAEWLVVLFVALAVAFLEYCEDFKSMQHMRTPSASYL